MKTECITAPLLLSLLLAVAAVPAVWSAERAAPATNDTEFASDADLASEADPDDPAVEEQPPPDLRPQPDLSPKKKDDPSEPSINASSDDFIPTEDLVDDAAVSFPADI